MTTMAFKRRKEIERVGNIFLKKREKKQKTRWAGGVEGGHISFFHEVSLVST
jgi:hypothetical protein